MAVPGSIEMQPPTRPEHPVCVTQHRHTLVGGGGGELTAGAVNHHEVECAVVERKSIEDTDAHLDEHACPLGATLHAHGLVVVRDHVRGCSAQAGFRRELAGERGVVHADLQQTFSELDARHRDRERVDIEPAKRKERHFFLMI